MYLYNQVKPKEIAVESTPVEENTALALYKSMLSIRMVEERIANEYHNDEMKTPIHLCIGEEAGAVGVCHSLSKKDLVHSNHRGHGHYLAKGGDLKRMMAELHCKETGCSHGRGGSMHLMDLDAGLAGSTSIVGGGIPLATGSAFSAKMSKTDRISTVFLGDAATEEGVFYESLNFAALKKLPLLYVCCNNFYSVCSPSSFRTSGEIYKRVSSFGIPSYLLDGTKVEDVYHATNKAIEHIKKGNGPVFFEIRAYRWRAHGGAKEDYQSGYRKQEEYDSWKAHCPILKYENTLKKRNQLDENKIASIKSQINQEIDEAFQFAKDSPLPKKEDLMKHIYA